MKVVNYNSCYNYTFLVKQKDPKMKMNLMFFMFFQICLLGHVYFAMPHGPPHGGAKVPIAACDDCDHPADVWEKFQPDDGDPTFIGANALMALLGEVEETTSASNATGFCNAPDPDILPNGCTTINWNHSHTQYTPLLRHLTVADAK